MYVCMRVCVYLCLYTGVLYLITSGMLTDGTRVLLRDKEDYIDKSLYVWLSML